MKKYTYTELKGIVQDKSYEIGNLREVIKELEEQLKEKDEIIKDIQNSI
jgi:hypothetical protein